MVLFLAIPSILILPCLLALILLSKEGLALLALCLPGPFKLSFFYDFFFF